MKKCYAQEVHHGRLYSNLNALVHKGFVSKEEHDVDLRVYKEEHEIETLIFE